MHLFLFTNTAQRELVSIYTQRIRNSINFPCLFTLIRPFKDDHTLFTMVPTCIGIKMCNVSSIFWLEKCLNLTIPVIVCNPQPIFTERYSFQEKARISHSFLIIHIKHLLVPLSIRHVTINESSLKALSL